MGDDSFTSWIQGGYLIRPINELLCKLAQLIYGCKWKIILEVKIMAAENGVLLEH
jgi:hypothetical protein